MTLKRLKNTDFYQKHRYRLHRANELLSLLSALCLILFLMGDQSIMAKQRHALSNEIKLSALITGSQTGVYNIDEAVIQAMARVPRHRYLTASYRSLAYTNVALPAKGQDYMIPEPFVTAMMAHLLHLDRNDRVLEIGFGQGYDAAVIGQLAGDVYSVEQKDPLQKISTHVRDTPKAHNIHMKDSNSQLGWPKNGPYDAILVRQSMAAPPVALIEQLKPGGRLVIPIGSPNETQRLTVFIKKDSGSLKKRSTLHMKISPLISGNEI